MCGIAGIVYKQGPGPVGDGLLKMLAGCQHRGPDSTGMAMYGPSGQELILRVFVNADGCNVPSAWPTRCQQAVEVLAEHEFHLFTIWQEGAFGRISGQFEGDMQQLSYAVEELRGVEIFSAGHALEIIKDEGTAADLDKRFGVTSFMGHHGIGHVRLATESDVSPSTAHPFWAYGFTDISIVHNGQITNYFKMRRRLEQRGYRFRTENDSEVIAVYLADKMTSGWTMDAALDQSLHELDGTFSFLVSTPEGIGYAKDRIGAKPMVVFETDRMVAVASEEVSLEQLAGPEKIESFEPYPGTSHTWSRSTPVSSAFAI